LPFLSGNIYLGAVLQLGKVESLAGRDLDVVQHNGGTGLLAGAGAGRRGKSTGGGSALDQLGSTRRSWGSRHSGGAEGQHGKEGCTHIEVNIRSTDKYGVEREYVPG
jgi:hypothetical protein